MTKIGLWNRLAIVATGLALLIAPLWVLVDQTNDHRSLKEAIYDYCIADAEEALANGEHEVYIDTHQRCLAERFPDSDPGAPGWDEWRMALAATAIICGIFYVLVWLTAWVTKWIWRGRKAA